jgi:hypothetical protein
VFAKKRKRLQSVNNNDIAQRSLPEDRVAIVMRWRVVESGRFQCGRLRAGTGIERAPGRKSDFATTLHVSVERGGDKQGCQMVYFQTKNINLGNFWRALDWKMLINFMTL